MSTRLLIVEDDIDLCVGLADILTAEGYQVDSAHDGGEGLALLERDAHEIVLLDIKLPGMTGIEILGRMKCRPPRGRIFIMSGAPDAEERLAAEGVGHMIAGIFRKPFDINSLLTRIKPAT